MKQHVVYFLGLVAFLKCPALEYNFLEAACFLKCLAFANDLWKRTIYFAQSFCLQSVDAARNSARVALADIDFPEGVNLSSIFVEDDIISGHVYLQTLRASLDSFKGIDLENITELALLFDQTQGGMLYIADIAIVKGG